jgi:autotransporter-associated beta strand protein
MPNVQVKDLVLNQQLNTLTAATNGRGIFQLVLTEYQANSGAVRVLSGASAWTGPVTLAGETWLEADGSQAIQNGITPASLNIFGVISDSPPGGDYTLHKIGLGTITFSGTNTYGGQTLVEAGVLQVNNPSALGAATPSGNTIVSAGAALELRSDLQLEPVTVYGDGIAFSGHFGGSMRNVSNNNVYTGPLTLGTDTTIGAESGTTLTIGADPAGLVSGTGSITDLGNNYTITKEQPGTLVLASRNVYGGQTTVEQGALRIEDPNALGDPALGDAGPFAGTVVMDGAQLQIARNDATLQPTVVTSEPLVLSGTGIFGTGALLNVRGDTQSGSNDNVWAGPITFSSVPNVSPESNPGSQIAIGVADSGLAGVTDTLTLNPQLGIQQVGTLASFGLIKVGPGRLALAQNNSFTGETNINGGTIQLLTNGGLGPVVSPEVQTVTVVGTFNSATQVPYTYTLSFQGQTTGTISSLASAAIVQAQLNALSTIGQSEVQKLNPGTGGTFTLTFNGSTTNPIASNASALTIQTELNKLFSVQHNSVQDVQVSGASGLFALTFDGETTTPLPYNETAANVQAALQKLPKIGTNNVTVTATSVAGGTVYELTFVGLLGNTNVPLVSAAPYVVAITQAGGAKSEILTVEPGLRFPPSRTGPG